jgi:DNA-binding NarL/FixJ family response regulator
VDTSATRLASDAAKRSARDDRALLATFGLDDYVYDALRAGASGFMLKDAPPEESETGVIKPARRAG